MLVLLSLSPKDGHAKAHSAAAAPDASVAKMMADHKFPGAAVLVMRGGKIIFQKGYGFANVEHKVPVTPQTMFQTGSVGKIFTSLALERLAEQGKWKLDDPICPHLPQCPDSWKAIIFDQLVRHTSGIPDWEHKGKTGEIVTAIKYRTDYSDADFLRIAQGLPLNFAPGTGQFYSNTAYVIAAVLINLAAGMHYSEYLSREIFKPAGMPTARILSDADIVPNRAAGYEIYQGKIRNQSWNSASINSTADGSLYFSLNDYAAWFRSMGRNPRTTTAHKYADRVVTLPSGKRVKYATGWTVIDEKGKRLQEKTGQWQGFRAYTFWVPSEDFAVVLLINGCVVDEDGNATDPGISQFGQAIVSHFRTGTDFSAGE